MVLEGYRLIFPFYKHNVSPYGFEYGGTGVSAWKRCLRDVSG
jgi:hypothetical protein